MLVGFLVRFCLSCPVRPMIANARHHESIPSHCIPAYIVVQRHTRSHRAKETLLHARVVLPTLALAPRLNQRWTDDEMLTGFGQKRSGLELPPHETGHDGYAGRSLVDLSACSVRARSSTNIVSSSLHDHVPSSLPRRAAIHSLRLSMLSDTRSTISALRYIYAALHTLSSHCRVCGN